MYLTASRVSEIVTKVGAYDLEHGKSKAYGRHLNWELTYYQVSRQKKERVLLITEAIAKRRLKTKEDKAYVQLLLCDKETSRTWE